MELNKQRVTEANIKLHSSLASVYKKEEPQYRPENVKNVRAILDSLFKQTNASQLLDVGCGAGFMIDIAKQFPLQKICGVDITDAMVGQIDKSGGVPIEIKMGDITEKIPFESESFEVATAYSVLSHLFSFGGLFKEVCRCLKPGGVFYTDLDPNYYFWNSLSKVPTEGTHHPYIQREISNTLNNDALLSQKFGIQQEVYNIAEFQKTTSGGMKEELVTEIFREAGFSRVDCIYHWFVGAAVINNDLEIQVGERQKLITEIDNYLQSTLPISRGLFKYISFRAWK